MSRRRAVLFATTALVFTLTACDDAPAPRPTTQTQAAAAACAAVDDAVVDAVAALDAVDPADPAAAADAIAAVGDRLRAASDAVSHTAVAELLPKMQDDLTAIGAALAAIADGDLSEPAALAAPVASMQDTFAQYREICGRS